MKNTSWKQIYSAFPLNIFLYFQLTCDDASKNVIFTIRFYKEEQKREIDSLF